MTTPIRAADLRKVRVKRRGLRPDDVRPGAGQHGGLPEPDQLHRRRCGHPARTAAIRSSSSRSRELVPRSRAGCCSTASCRHDGRARCAGRRPSTTTACRPRGIGGLFDGLAEDPHPMGALIAAFGALGTFYPEAHKIADADGAAAAESAGSSRGRRRWPPTPHAGGAGEPVVPPAEGLSFAGNFLAHAARRPGPAYEPHPVLERALDVLFILHADHEQNCSTCAMRSVGSSTRRPVLGGRRGDRGALRPAARRRANEAVLRMLHEHRLASTRCRPSSSAVKAGDGRADGLRPPRLQVTTTRAPRSSSESPTRCSR